MKIGEENFIRELINKNPKALEYIINTYGNLVYKIVYSILNENHHETEECMDDVFVSVWSNIVSFKKDKGNFKNWIACIAKYKAIDYSRKSNFNDNVENLDDYNLTAEVNIEGEIISKENRKEILNLVNSMKEVDREIFIRRYFLDEDIEFISQKVNMNRANVDNRLSRGRKFLKEKFDFFKKEVI
ncbi:sigma-70 family RNA polymerase sigma factor [Clostridium peptidivorans]|uniref:sigma-70 family RNA polymerase sigma factor n=1 Tax=Clostridium peptidivorans TaxID=100174 RepID=UPI000BE2D092|nr:sigma-70 family RNA polymerase sigma factor [Clostridium peptidivorans]